MVYKMLFGIKGHINIHLYTLYFVEICKSSRENIVTISIAIIIENVECCNCSVIK